MPTWNRLKELQICSTKFVLPGRQQNFSEFLVTPFLISGSKSNKWWRNISKNLFLAVYSKCYKCEKTPISTLTYFTSDLYFSPVCHFLPLTLFASSKFFFVILVAFLQYLIAKFNINKTDFVDLKRVFSLLLVYIFMLSDHWNNKKEKRKVTQCNYVYHKNISQRTLKLLQKVIWTSNSQFKIYLEYNLTVEYTVQFNDWKRGWHHRVLDSSFCIVFMSSRYWGWRLKKRKIKEKMRLNFFIKRIYQKVKFS